ncbi:MAG: hypothetical protein P9L89_00400 [Candidatus Celaenobacter polaris]|nr:hypothetical protein [Candidatus Celaenobacter polaris]
MKKNKINSLICENLFNLCGSACHLLKNRTQIYADKADECRLKFVMKENYNINLFISVNQYDQCKSACYSLRRKR